MEAFEHEGAWRVVVEHGRRATYEPGRSLFLEGDPSRSVYACVEGRLRVFLTLPSGQELLLGMRLPGEVVGELSALDGRPRSASVTVVETSVIAHLPADRFLEALRDVPELSVAVSQNLSAQLRRANDRLAIRNSNSASVRTGKMLVELASLLMRHSGPSSSYEIAVTQSDLADWIGATRESTARALAKFRRAGLVETSRGRIVVLDVVALSDLVAATV